MERSIGRPERIFCSSAGCWAAVRRDRRSLRVDTAFPAAELLASCYRTSLEVAKQNGIRRIAFPSISTGIYRFPVDLAAVTAVREVRRRIEEYPDAFDLILWVLFDEKTKRAYDAALAE